MHLYSDSCGDSNDSYLNLKNANHTDRIGPENVNIDCKNYTNKSSVNSHLTSDVKIPKTQVMSEPQPPRIESTVNNHDQAKQNMSFCLVSSSTQTITPPRNCTCQLLSSDMLPMSTNNNAYPCCCLPSVGDDTATPQNGLKFLNAFSNHGKNTRIANVRCDTQSKTIEQEIQEMIQGGYVTRAWMILLQLSSYG